MEIAARWRWFVAVCLLFVGSLDTADDKNTPIDPSIIKSLLNSKLKLIPGTGTFEAWQVKDITFDIFLFNWTNAVNFPWQKPHLTEVGPYRFRMRRKYVDFKFYDKDDMLGYRVNKTWKLERTGLSLDDRITTVDYLTLELVRATLHISHPKRLLKNDMIKKIKRGAFTTKTVRELLFDGYNDFFLDMYRFIAPPRLNLSEKFGWFYEKNDTVDRSEGHLGTTQGLGLFPNMTVPGQIIYWEINGKLSPTNSFYDGPCTTLIGSLGDFFPRALTKESNLTIFVPTMCRVIPLRYSSSGVYRGLDYHKYEATLSELDEEPYDRCFCRGRCLFKGVMNMTACRENRPLFMSLPHFLHGDPRLHGLVDGLNPDLVKHSFYYSVEPRTGIPLDVAVRYQMNVYLEADDAFQFYKDLPSMLFPVYWVQERTSADQRSLKSLVPRKNV